MRASARRFSPVFVQPAAGRRKLACGLLGAGALFGCTLLTDVDRERIPVPVQPPFSEVDAGPGPEHPELDASVPPDVPDAAGAGEPDAAAPADAGDDAG